MKKVIRLTESDLARIVKKVISEQIPTDEPMMGKSISNEFDWKSHFDQIKNELDSYLNTVSGPVDVKRFQRKVMNTYYQMVSNVDDEYSYPSHGEDFQQLTTDFMSYFTNKLKELVQNYGKLTESDLARIVKKALEEQTSDSDIRRLDQLRKNIEKKYPDMCEGLEVPIPGGRPGYLRIDVKLGKNLPFDPEVKEFQMIYNKMYPDYKKTVDGIVGPQMRGIFCIPS